MVGGTVKKVVKCVDKVWVNCTDRRDECAIYVERSIDADHIEPGDKLWWQGQLAMWTPRNQAQIEDRKLRRVSSSGVPRP